MGMDSRLLPQSFVDAYEALQARALTDGSGSNHPLSGRDAELGKADGKPTGQWPEKTSDVTSIGQVGGPKTKQVGKTSKFLADERAFRLKRKIDKRLRGLGREMMAFLEGASEKDAAAAASRLCTGKCRKIGDGEWVFCARCGGPMRDMDGEEK